MRPSMKYLHMWGRTFCNTSGWQWSFLRFYGKNWAGIYRSVELSSQHVRFNRVTNQKGEHEVQQLEGGWKKLESGFFMKQNQKQRRLGPRMLLFWLHFWNPGAKGRRIGSVTSTADTTLRQRSSASAAGEKNTQINFWQTWEESHVPRLRHFRDGYSDTHMAMIEGGYRSFFILKVW